MSQEEIFTECVSQDHLMALFRDTLQFRQQLEPREFAVLNETIRDFLARNAGPLSALLNNPAFTEFHAILTRELLERAYASANGPEERKWVAAQAVKVGYEDLFPAEEAYQDIFTDSQARAFEQLRAMAILHFRGCSQNGIQLRTTPLLLGPSGVGKTHLIERLGKVLRLDVMRVTVGDWMVMGARVDPHTLRQLHSRVRSGKKFIFQIDEIDKFRDTRDTWSQAQMTEMFNVLDRRMAGGAWTEADIQKLKQNVFVVGSGTFQDIWHEQATRRLGFGGPTGEFDLVGKIRKARIIPTEITARFNSEWLILEPFTVADFEGIARRHNLPRDVLDPVAAAAGGQNYRAVETCLTTAALKGVIQEIRDSEGKDLSADSHLET